MLSLHGACFILLVYNTCIWHTVYMAIFSSVENGLAEDGSTDIYVAEVTGNLTVQNGQQTRKTEIGKHRYM